MGKYQSVRRPELPTYRGSTVYYDYYPCLKPTIRTSSCRLSLIMDNKCLDNLCL